MTEKNLSYAVNQLIQANRTHKRLIDSGVCIKIGLHRTQHIILMRLAREEKLPSQKNLAEHLNVTPAAVTGALQKLEASGYIERKIGDDNRYNEITITDAGLRIVEKSREMFNEIDKQLFDGFDESELMDFVGYLERINNNLTKYMEVKN